MNGDSDTWGSSFVLLMPLSVLGSQVTLPLHRKGNRGSEGIQWPARGHAAGLDLDLGFSESKVPGL